ncbi:hypothetical protein ACH4XT_02080 [Streptomyces avidinii]|uniref:hypothetical protein n=1 Tax=Streptomyces avidinii TaxID=1895 RepID=UPI0037A8F7FE|nr:hypothetical protein OG592_06395 [Streptomyces avidinii]
MNISFAVKVLLVVICALVSVIVAMVAALIQHTPFTPKGPAFLYGGGAFAGSMLLCVGVLSALGLF